MDHLALQHFPTNPGRDPHKSSKFVHWAKRLSVFNYKSEYQRGIENTAADALSHLPAPTTGPAIIDPGEQLILKRLSSEGLPLSDVISATTGDPLLQQAISYVRTDWPSQKKITPELHPFYLI